MRVIKVLIRKILDRLKQGTLSEIETLIITKQRLQWNLKDRRSLGKDQDGQIEWVCVYACVCLFVCVRVGEGEWQPGRIGVRMLMGGRRAGYDEKEISLFHPHLPTHKNMVSQQARCSGQTLVKLRRPDNNAFSFNDLKYPDVDSFQPCLTLVHLLLFVDV